MQSGPLWGGTYTFNHCITALAQYNIAFMSNIIIYHYIYYNTALTRYNIGRICRRRVFTYIIYYLYTRYLL